MSKSPRSTSNRSNSSTRCRHCVSSVGFERAVSPCSYQSDSPLPLVSRQRSKNIREEQRRIPSAPSDHLWRHRAAVGHSAWGFALTRASLPRCHFACLLRIARVAECDWDVLEKETNCKDLFREVSSRRSVLLGWRGLPSDSEGDVVVVVVAGGAVGVGCCSLTVASFWRSCCRGNVWSSWKSN